MVVLTATLSTIKPDPVVKSPGKNAVAAKLESPVKKGWGALMGGGAPKPSAALLQKVVKPEIVECMEDDKSSDNSDSEKDGADDVLSVKSNGEDEAEDENPIDNFVTRSRTLFNDIIDALQVSIWDCCSVPVH